MGAKTSKVEIQTQTSNTAAASNGISTSDNGDNVDDNSTITPVIADAAESTPAAPPTMPLSRDRESTRKAFKKYDMDDSGSVERDEAKIVLAKELAFDDQQVEQLLDTFDRNRDNKLSYDEFAALYAAVHSVKDKLFDDFQRIDKDKTGKISVEELFTALQPFQFTEQQVKDMVSLHDTDHDGYIEFDEFVKFWK